MISVKEIFLRFLRSVVEIASASSTAQRLRVVCPFLAAFILSAGSVSLNIFLRDGSNEHYVFDFLSTAGIFLLFFLPLTLISVPLMARLSQHFPERRYQDALIAGIYLPQAFVTLFIVYSQLAGSGTITSITGAIVTWAMFTLLLTPLTIIFSFLIWSFTPKTVPQKLVQILSLPKNKPLPALTQRVEEQDINPPSERMSRISNTAYR